MTKSIVLRGGATALLCLSLSACLGNGNNGTAGGGGAGSGGSGGSGGGAPSQSDFDTNIARVQGIAPSSVKLTGTFDYEGQTLLKTRDSAGTENGFITGDVEATLNFDAETASGSATNFAGEVDGNAVTIDGTLDTNNAVGGTLISATNNVPPVGDITVTSISLNLEGQLTEQGGGNTADVSLLLGGSVLGNNAEAVTGAAVAASTNVNGVAGIGELGAGQFYLDKK